MEFKPPDNEDIQSRTTVRPQSSGTALTGNHGSNVRHSARPDGIVNHQGMAYPGAAEGGNLPLTDPVSPLRRMTNLGALDRTLLFLSLESELLAATRGFSYTTGKPGQICSFS